MSRSQPSSKQVMPVANALGWSFLLCAIVGGMGTLLAYEPDFRHTPVLGLVTVWTLTLLIGIATFWNARRPGWLPLFIQLFGLATLFLASAINALSPYFSNWLWIAYLSTMYILAWALPFLPLRFVNTLSDEQVRPRIRLEQTMSLIILFLAILGILVIGWFTHRRIQPVQPVMLFIGAASALAAISMAQSFACQVRERLNSEIQARKVTK